MYLQIAAGLRSYKPSLSLETFEAAHTKSTIRSVVDYPTSPTHEQTLSTHKTASRRTVDGRESSHVLDGPAPMEHASRLRPVSRVADSLIASAKLDET